MALIGTGLFLISLPALSWIWYVDVSSGSCGDLQVPASELPEYKKGQHLQDIDVTFFEQARAELVGIYLPEHTWASSDVCILSIILKDPVLVLSPAV